MGNNVVRPAKPNRLNVWGARSSAYDWQHWFWRYRDFRVLFLFVGLYVWSNPGKLKMLEWSRSQSEFDKKQEEYERIKFYERHRKKYYDERDSRLHESERREISSNQQRDQVFASAMNDLMGLKKETTNKYFDSKWEAGEISSGSRDKEIKLSMNDKKT